MKRGGKKYEYSLLLVHLNSNVLVLVFGTSQPLSCTRLEETLLALVSMTILNPALFSISLLNGDNPQASGISQGTKPNLGAAQTV